MAIARRHNRGCSAKPVECARGQSANLGFGDRPRRLHHAQVRRLTHTENMPATASTVSEAPSSLAMPLATPARMKVFFVGDNRSTVNWGRAASIALGQLLSASFEITGRLMGDFFDLFRLRLRPVT